MTGRLAGKLAVITGAGAGIGKAAALLFAAAGATVGVLDASAEAAAETVTLVEKNGGLAQPLVADVAAAAEIEAAIDEFAGARGGLHVLYNNAGVGSVGSIAVVDEAYWDRCFDVNVKGTYLCSRAALRHLGDGGAIVNQGSVAALAGAPNLAAYGAAKGAVVALTRSMAIDLAPRGIRVNAICPGTAYTPLMEPMLGAGKDHDHDLGLAATMAKYPVGRLSTPEDIANVALFLASDEAAFTGVVITWDGGMTAQ